MVRMSKQLRQTSRRVRAMRIREAQARGLSPYRVDVDRGLARLLIGVAIAGAMFLSVNMEPWLYGEFAGLAKPVTPGSAILVIGAVLLGAVYLRIHAPELVRSKPQLAVYGFLCVVPLVAARAAALGGVSPQLVPLGVVVFVIALRHGTQVAVTTSLALSFFVALALRNDLHPVANPEAVTLLGGAMVWTFGASHIRKRLWLFKVGIFAALMQLWLATGIDLLAAGQFTQNGLWAAANGVVTGGVLTAMLPIIEYVFRVDTEISLLELCDLNQPLLKRLGLEAPGTYHHSLVVGNLAEAAAEAMGADPLLARVGSYFHDIGKLAKPTYFVENQGTEGSRHTRLAPSMSALIIAAHVKDGAEVAEEYDLPRTIVDIIRQHHGTSLMEFFYQRSLEIEPDEPSSEQMFRYPGPKPETREAALILLADSVEAASRTLPDPSPARLQSLVHELTMKKLLDGQLNESPLTLKDVAKAESCFARVLAASFHGRIKYPGANDHGPGEPRHSPEHPARPDSS